MANPWNTTSPIEKEPELLDVMSKELSERLQVEDDYVWVSLHEVQEQIDEVTSVNSPLTTSNKSLTAPSSQNIVQSDDSTPDIRDDDAIHIIYYDEDSDAYDIIQHPEPDVVDDMELKMDSLRPVNMLKFIYPMPKWLKQTERGTSRTTADKDQSNKKKNSLLPEIDYGASTTAVLERFINNRYLGRYNEVVGRGKNSVVHHAECHWRNCRTMPVNNAVKIYKLTSDKEKNKLIFKRVQREFENLNIVRKHLTNCTFAQPIRAWENVIVMSFVGFDSTVAPSIQDLPWQIKEDTNMYLAIVDLMHKCYNVFHLVHGKLCTQNIRCWFERPHFIGWGHSVKTNHPQALPKLIKDCKFVSEVSSIIKKVQLNFFVL